jgi:hypothetical protein
MRKNLEISYLIGSPECIADTLNISDTAELECKKAYGPKEYAYNSLQILA